MTCNILPHELEVGALVAVKGVISSVDVLSVHDFVEEVIHVTLENDTCIISRHELTSYKSPIPPAPLCERVLVGGDVYQKHRNGWSGPSGYLTWGQLVEEAHASSVNIVELTVGSTVV